MSLTKEKPMSENMSEANIKTITIEHAIGGVQTVRGCPPGYAVILKDYDAPDYTDRDRKVWTDGSGATFCETVYPAIDLPAVTTESAFEHILAHPDDAKIWNDISDIYSENCLRPIATIKQLAQHLQLESFIDNDDNHGSEQPNRIDYDQLAAMLFGYWSNEVERENLMTDTVTNSNRSEWARLALFKFARTTRMDTAGEEDSTILQDLLAALRHWCDTETINFDEVSDMARTHYAEEVSDYGKDS
jgi:hypothetical protein